MQANAPKVFPKNSPQVAAVNDGALEIGWVNHYYLHRVDPNGRKAANWSFPADSDAGNVMMVAGMGRLSHSDAAASADALMAWFVSQPVQRVFGLNNKEYPPARGGDARRRDAPRSGERGDRRSGLTDRSRTHARDAQRAWPAVNRVVSGPTLASRGWAVGRPLFGLLWPPDDPGDASDALVEQIVDAGPAFGLSVALALVVVLIATALGG